MAAALSSDLVSPGALKQLSGKIQIDGSSSLFPVTEVVGEDFQDATGKNVNVPIAHAGTGGGFKRFVRGEIDLCNASRPITTKEREGCAEAGIEFIELPVCFDALTIAVHPSNPLKSISVEQLKAMWAPESEGKVLKWNDVAAEWPDLPLRLFGAGSDSGTFDYFTEAIVGKARSSRTDYTASEDDNALVQGIQGDKGALGYIPFAYYTENTTKVKALAVDWEKDEEGAIDPTLENVLAAKYNPLSRPLFLYVNRKSADRPEVRAFVEFYLVKASELVQEVKYMPLTSADYALVLERFRANKTGSAFDGKPEVGVALSEILKREPK
ncbi:MAG: PstS family phosphate ABC transporter substrate-binding protein [Planctomycetaceae bacterium]